MLTAYDLFSFYMNTLDNRDEHDPALCNMQLNESIFCKNTADYIQDLENGVIKIEISFFYMTKITIPNVSV